MKLSEPKNVTFIISVILAALGVLAWQGMIVGLAGYGIQLVLAGFILLALGNLLKGL